MDDTTIFKEFILKQDAVCTHIDCDIYERNGRFHLIYFPETNSYPEYVGEYKDIELAKKQAEKFT